MATTLQEPKRPASSYFLYVNATRDQIQKELGVKNFGAVTKVQAERWKTLPAAQKEKYEKEAAGLKTQYEKDCAAFKEAGGVMGQARADKKEAKKEKADKKAKKLENAGKPKKIAGGAFGIWLNAHRAEIQASLPAGSKCTAVAPVASARWKALSEKDKKPWEEKYQVASAKYKEELKAWQEAKGGDADEEEGSGAEDAAEATEEKSAPAPKKRAKSGDAEKTSSPPAKKAKGKSGDAVEKTSSPPAKKAKGKGRGRAAADAAATDDKQTIDPAVLEKASKIGLDNALKNLAARDGMSNIPSDKMLAALQQANGLVNKAKFALLAGA